MNLLNVIDQMSWKEYLIFISLFFAIVNFAAWVVLMKRQKLGKSLKAMADKLVKSGGFIDGGVIAGLAVSAIIALVVTQETNRNTVPKTTVVDQKTILIDDKVYRCEPIRQRVVRYYDLEEKKTRPLPLPPKKECK